MDKFNWQQRLNDIYASFPEAERQPVVGITANYGEQTAKLTEYYYKSVQRAGATPLIIPPLDDTNAIVNTLSHIDALILSGGGDFNPLFSGEEPQARLGTINAERDLPELLITRLAYNRQLPILGICRGIQTLVMALGGRVTQDLGQSKMKHSQQAERSEPTHTVRLAADSLLARIYNKVENQPADDAASADQPSEQPTLFVNSFHHQAVRETGPRFRVTAKSTDGVIEAIESTEFKPILGVQWHPECLADGAPIFEWLAEEARQFRAANDLHDRILTLDTHCDTPMFFPQNVQFAQRDPRILVDLHKMTEGRLDATIMAAYLPQPKIGETFSSKVEFDVASPTDYADLIFDKIEEIVEKNRKHISIARRPADLYADKREGRKSIMLAIENGLALGGKLENVEHFAKRGVVYITLCHNGDNDVCDSARGSTTHNGVSRFGRQVIREMNRLGIMVDLSHASEKSFYDALQLSQTPIVCTHSCCRALCDHPRNLTDEQMKALAERGGVMQVNLYKGFLTADGEANIHDFMRHVDHAIDVMGIEHVGIGSDFDGDGGVPGLADASELINYTRQLMERKYTEKQIQRLWGGNFINVMSIVKRTAEQ